MPIPNGILCKIGADFTLGSQPFLFLTVLKNQHKVYAKKTSKELSVLLAKYPYNIKVVINTAQILYCGVLRLILIGSNV